MKKYCFNCGANLVFSAREKPKFCVQCGKPLEFESSSNAHDEDQEPYEEEVRSRDINIKGLDFEFDPEELKVRKEPIESLMGTLDKVSDFTMPADFPTVTKKDMLEQYKREAGTLRDNKRSEKDDGER